MVAINNPPPLARHLDLMVVEAQTTAAELERACEQANTLQAAALCVPGAWVALARSHLEDSGVKVCALISHPLGLMTADVKRYEIEAALDEGAQEFEVVANHALLRGTEARLFVREVRDLVEAAEEHPVKVVIRPELLTLAETLRAAAWCVDAEAHCLAVAPAGEVRPSPVEIIKQLSEALSGCLFFKASLSGASRSLVADLLAAGAMRVGINVEPLR